MTFFFIFGTRPEIIKLSPLIRACILQNIPHKLIHTGQHYSYELSDLIFKDLNLPKPDYNLEIGSAPHGEQTGKIMIALEPILIKEHPSAIIVLGDPNSAFAGALTASKLHIPVCHVEAGRRSFDKRMPEELNRLMIDQIADTLFTPNEWTQANLLREGIDESNIIISGDPIVDAVSENTEIASQKSSMIHKLGLSDGNYFLATIHRPENVDDYEKLSEIISAFKKLSQRYDCPFVFPVHPKTWSKIAEYKLDCGNLVITPALGYIDFLSLESKCKALLTDSGSLQEEACILQIPCVTIREDTERQETIEIGANVLTSASKSGIISAVDLMLQKPRTWGNPFGERGTGERIMHNIQHIYRKAT
ncbi:MAG: UDP-N-acetylglucosamine 2-epimerase (non-hydrolyzing) [Clostridium lundense]|nr:UDP-N-acetylglucosamine 2-epimerase (non-hydrolyzing) [Clostridium lundense]MBE6515630.1 UDP-N-acetylglucosamine 2-epimerase (non-hydrolyzing) [Methanocorpusculum parvum]